MAVAFKSPSSASVTDKPEIKASSVPNNAAQVPVGDLERRKMIYEAKDKRKSDWEKANPGKSYYAKPSNKTEDFVPVGGGDNSSKQKDTSCRTC